MAQNFGRIAAKSKGEDFRFAVASEMIAVDASNESIHAYFKIQSNYKKWAQDETNPLVAKVCRSIIEATVEAHNP